MSTDRVWISTHDLPLAGALRDGFRGEGYDVELVTPNEEIERDPDAALWVLTGGVARSGSLVRRVTEEFHLPILAVVDGEELPSEIRRALDDVFDRTTPTEDIILVGRSLVERRRLRRVTGIVGRTDAMRQVLERVVQIAPVGSTVLVTGESGTGKELVARGIHALSPRRYKAFIAVNVAALSETLLESELFGHEKGSFTGAIDTRKGMFELAHGGTIFLDEIGEMPIATQTKLLRVLEQREFHRVGGERTIKVDVRVVAATNQDLRQLVARGEFRRDLYFRLNVLGIELPPLRERKQDIPLLVETFVRELAEAHDLAFPGISEDAMKILVEHSWPGNVRELKNLVESMVVLAPRHQIRPEDIPNEVRAGRGNVLLPVRSSETEGERKEGAGRDVLRPELEFVFRTLVDMRVDLDDLRRDFDAYRREQPRWDPRHGPVLGTLRASEDADIPDSLAVAAYAPGESSEGTFRPESRDEKGPGPMSLETADEDDDEDDTEDAAGTVVFRPGLTMDEMERRAISAALAEVDGNRRKAAELLGIGERTLYRKIAKYGLDA